MKLLLTAREKLMLCAILLVPLGYIVFLQLTLPAGSAEHKTLPWSFVLLMLIPMLAIATDFSGSGQRYFMKRVVDNPNYRKLSLMACTFISFGSCYLLRDMVYPAAVSTKWLAAGMAVFLALLGNYQVALSQPAYLPLTFNTPFMRRYGDLVARSYRLAARLLFWGGLLSLALVWQLPEHQSLMAVVSMELAVGVIAFSTFWFWYAQRRRLAAFSSN